MECGNRINSDARVRVFEAGSSFAGNSSRENLGVHDLWVCHTRDLTLTFWIVTVVGTVLSDCNARIDDKQ